MPVITYARSGLAYSGVTYSDFYDRQYFMTLTAAETPAGAFVVAPHLTKTATSTSAATITKAARPTKTGALTPSGALPRALSAFHSGAVTIAGAVRHTARRIVSGAVTSLVGLVSRVPKLSKLGDGIGTDGRLAKSTTTHPTGALTSIGDPFKSVRPSKSGTLTSAGELPRVVYQRLVAALTSLGTLLKSSRTVLTGVWTGTGQTFRLVSLYVTAGVTTAGALLRAASLQLLSALTGTGTPSTSLVFRRVMTAVVTHTGNILRSASRISNRTFISSGSPVRFIAAVRAGSLDIVGLLSRHLTRIMNGVVASVGTPTRFITTVVSRTFVSAGAFTVQWQKSLTAALTSVGVATVRFVALLHLTGVLSSIGQTAKSVWIYSTGAVTPSRVMSRATSIVHSATTPFSAATRHAIHIVQSGLVTPVGALRRHIAWILTAAWTGVGSITRTIQRVTVGAVSAVTQRQRTTSQIRTSTLTSTGAPTFQRILAVILSGLLDAVSDVQKQGRALFSGSITTGGSLSRSVTLVRAGILVSGRTMRRVMQQIRTRVLSPVHHRVRLIRATFTARLDQHSTMVRTTVQRIGRVLVVSGTRLRHSQLVRGGLVAASAVTTPLRTLGRTMTAILVSVGSRLRLTQHTASGAVLTAGISAKSTSLYTSSSLSMMGVVRRLFRRTLDAVLTMVRTWTHSVHESPHVFLNILATSATRIPLNASHTLMKPVIASNTTFIPMIVSTEKTSLGTNRIEYFKNVALSPYADMEIEDLPTPSTNCITLPASASTRLIFQSTFSTVTHMAIEQNFTIYRNTAPRLRFQMNPKEDVTEWTTQLHVVTRDGQELITRSGTPTVGVPNAFGCTDVDMTASMTAALPLGSFTYSFRRLDAGYEDVLTTGVMVVKDAV